jgi:hypothetical protein
MQVDGQDVGDVLISENLAHPYVCGRYSCPRRKPWCPFEAQAGSLRSPGMPAIPGSATRSARFLRSRFPHPQPAVGERREPLLIIHGHHSQSTLPAHRKRNEQLDGRRDTLRSRSGGGASMA